MKWLRKQWLKLRYGISDAQAECMVLALWEVPKVLRRVDRELALAYLDQVEALAQRPGDPTGEIMALAKSFLARAEGTVSR